MRGVATSGSMHGRGSRLPATGVGFQVVAPLRGHG
jgi:hypothetical protein